jgi:hypothetical protein
MNDQDKEKKENMDMKVLNVITKKCFKKCVFNFWTDKFVNEE